MDKKANGWNVCFGSPGGLKKPIFIFLSKVAG
jgi:hypothetical protein